MSESDDDDERSVDISTRKKAGIAAGVVIAIAVFVLFPVGETADPQPALNASHADANLSCANCHTVSQGTTQGITNQKCVNCHAATVNRTDDLSEDQIARLEGMTGDPLEPSNRSVSLHERLDEGRRCTSCHTEHKGRMGDITQRFNHSEFTDEYECEDCHQVEETRPVPKGHPSLKQFEREKILGELGCEGCHTTEDWSSEYNHSHVGLPNEVSLNGWDDYPDRPQCLACHETPNQQSSAHFNVPFDLEDELYQCKNCHLSTRDWTNWYFNHDFFPTNMTDKGCAGCHARPNWHPTIQPAVVKDCSNCHSLGSWNVTRQVGR